MSVIITRRGSKVQKFLRSHPYQNTVVKRHAFHGSLSLAAVYKRQRATRLADSEKMRANPIMIRDHLSGR